MKSFTISIILNGITEQSFNEWKHHPCTKLYMRFLKDYERQLAERQMGLLRHSGETPDPFKLGTFTGQINAVAEMAEPKFQSIVEFYPPDEEEEDQQ